MHLALQRGSGPERGEWPERPPGLLVWIHVARGERLPALLQLAARLIGQRKGMSVLFSAADGVVGPRRLKPGIIWTRAPEGSRRQARAFVAHFKPDVCVWASGDLIPTLVDAAHDAEMPLVLVDAEETGLGKAGLKALTDPIRAMLSLFSTILAADNAAAARLTRLGVAADRIEVTGPLQEGSAAIPCRDDDLTELTEAIGPRPVWLAAMVQPEETVSVLRAHRASSRFAQRLLLILVPDKPEMADEMAAHCETEALRFVRWSNGEFPDDQTEVLLADTVGEMGLWYRLAPVSFMASSLVAGRGGCDPFEPAALGSAVLYGPHCGRHLNAYSRLVAAGAARMVRDTDSLIAALKHLTGPDRAAAMALAAWEVVSEGAGVADRVTDLVQDILDHAEVA